MKYIAFLRGINVGATKRIKMAELKVICEGIGLGEVETYIQSGNVIFESQVQDASKLEKKIEAGLESALGYDVTVILRSAVELGEIVALDPFKSLSSNEDDKLYVTLLQEEPDPDAVEGLDPINNDYENYSLVGRELYVVCERVEDYKAVFSNNLVEKKLGVRATTRNWGVINKVHSQYCG